MRVQCACIWRNERCPNDATAEDGFCNWCASTNSRTTDQMRSDPRAVIAPDGRVFGIGGGPDQAHDGTTADPGACWYPDSGRQRLEVGR